MVCDFSNKSITFRQLIENKWNFDKNVWKIFSEEVEDLV